MPTPAQPVVLYPTNANDRRLVEGHYWVLVKWNAFNQLHTRIGLLVSTNVEERHWFLDGNHEYDSGLPGETQIVAVLGYVGKAQHFTVEGNALDTLSKRIVQIAHELAFQQSPNHRPYAKLPSPITLGPLAALLTQHLAQNPALADHPVLVEQGDTGPTLLEIVSTNDKAVTFRGHSRTVAKQEAEETRHARTDFHRAYAAVSSISTVTNIAKKMVDSLTDKERAILEKRLKR